MNARFCACVNVCDENETMQAHALNKKNVENWPNKQNFAKRKIFQVERQGTNKHFPHASLAGFRQGNVAKFCLKMLLPAKIWCKV